MKKLISVSHMVFYRKDATEKVTFGMICDK